MKELFDHLKSRIESEGSLTVADYMAEALGNQNYGYYRKGDPLGKNGDFITSPEVSQMFGELIGLWSAICWQQIGSPSKINLVELGPGRGTLLVDAVRAVTGMPEYLDAIELHLVETSPVLVQHQIRNLSTLNKICRWHENFGEVPNGPFVLIGNEFLDALPVRQFVKTFGQWSERLIGLDKNGTCLRWTTSSYGTDWEFPVPPALDGCDEGMIWEVCADAQDIVASISSAIMERQGIALFIDYGYVKQTGGDTFQAVQNHDFTDPLETPGEADLTAHVDFEAIKRVAVEKGVRVSGPIPQGDFLRGLGIEQRAGRIMTTATKRQQLYIHTGLSRLIDEDEMGTLFKVIALSHPNDVQPEGF